MTVAVSTQNAPDTLAPAPTPSERRTLDFGEVADVLADVSHLRQAGYDALGVWSLPQIAAHLAHVIEHALTPPPNIEPTPEQTARRERFFSIVFGPGGMPANMPLPAESLPPATSGEEQFDRLAAALSALTDYPHTHVLAGGAGPISTKDARKLHLAHAKHHLSFLIPRPTRRQHLRFATERGVLADLDRLKAGYRKVGNWTLSQTCWHLAAPMRIAVEAAGPVESPEQQALLVTLQQRYANAGDTPQGLQAPPGTEPPADCDSAAFDELITRLIALEAFKGAFVAFGRYGVVPTEIYHAFVLDHCAHHLSLLVPNAARREGLRFDHEDEAAYDIHHLRRGYMQTGGWTLGQICWHLAATTQARMTPGPHPTENTPEQEARGGLLKFVMATGRLPLGIMAPETLLPPADAGDESINACLDALEQIKQFSGRFAPHRLFGYLPEQDVRRHNMIHFAHHLSNLIPTT